VDDGSGRPIAQEIDDMAASSSLRIRVLHVDHNSGPAGGRNPGWRSTTAPLIAFTDDDCVPRPGWLAAGLAALEANPRIGVLQGRTTRPDGSERYPTTYLTVIREVLSPSPWFEGCNLFFRREALLDGGGFDETIRWFGEETALGWSVLDAGWARDWAGDAVVQHDLTERPWRWHLRNHYLEGNLVRVAARHPAIRDMFWRPWAIKRENALFALAVLGLLAGCRRRAGLLLAVPYLRTLPRPWEGWQSLQGAVHQASVHAASLAGKTIACAQERTFLL
jgi:GT2 family glycosyltransferase